MSGENSESSQTNPINDHSSPFYLHPSDSPGMLFVNSPFDAKNKLGMIDGSIEAPDVTSVNHKPWARCNDMVISWILNSLSKDIAESVLYSKTAREIWKELATSFSQCNGAQLYQLQKELSDAMQGNLDIAGYFTKVKKIWAELDAIITFDHYNCKCICGGRVKTIQSHQDGRLIQFLMGLNSSYSSVKSTILMMDPLPTEVHMEAHPSESAFMVSNPRFSNGQRFTNNNTQQNNNNGARFSNNNQKYGWSDGKLKGNFDK
ncbi:uncharacterized protein LOC132034933 [Lycium ferocissimum]|uniref:uncharacterized protein LOC132034933 n=1 Tax=Lycium ferocissimum TaxID=112874 RepID=UPI0028169458|nr:uncharacterized protein LOC132034933 [Lycium ferocissimum]